MTKVALIPYKMSSEGAKKVATALQIPMIQDVVDFGGRGTFLINWGCGILPARPKPNTRIINKPEAVSTAINKLHLFRAPNTFSRPPHTEIRDTAKAWIYLGKTVCARTRVEGCDGAGLVVVSPQNYQDIGGMPEARLYTEFIPCDKEYRAHVAFGKVIAYQIRAKKSGWQGGDDRVRTSSNGYGFNVPDDIPESVTVAALACFKEFELDFMALDILYNSETEKAYVLEFNSAPEMTPYTTTKYCEAFRSVITDGEQV